MNNHIVVGPSKICACGFYRIGGVDQAVTCMNILNAVARLEKVALIPGTEPQNPDILLIVDVIRSRVEDTDHL